MKYKHVRERTSNAASSQEIGNKLRSIEQKISVAGNGFSANFRLFFLSTNIRLGVP